eukprot:Opistho-2@3267
MYGQSADAAKQLWLAHRAKYESVYAKQLATGGIIDLDKEARKYVLDSSKLIYVTVCVLVLFQNAQCVFPVDPSSCDSDACVCFCMCSFLVNLAMHYSRSQYNRWSNRTNSNSNSNRNSNRNSSSSSNNNSHSETACFHRHYHQKVRTIIRTTIGGVPRQTTRRSTWPVAPPHAQTRRQLHLRQKPLAHRAPTRVHEEDIARAGTVGTGTGSQTNRHRTPTLTLTLRLTL